MCMLMLIMCMLMLIMLMLSMLMLSMLKLSMFRLSMLRLSICSHWPFSFSFFSQVHDLSAAEIYPDEVAAIISALMKHNTLESCKRALALMSLWRSAGRASEPAYLHYDAFTWNSLHKTPVIEMPQSKSSKCKMIPLSWYSTQVWDVSFGQGAAPGARLPLISSCVPFGVPLIHTYHSSVNSPGTIY